MLKKVSSLSAILLIAILLSAGCGSSSPWTNTGGGLSSYGVVSFAYDSTHDVLYAGTLSHGVWRCNSPRTSPNWTNTGGGLTSYVIYGLAYDPTHDIVYAGGFGTGGAANSVKRGVWRCTNPRTSPSWTDTVGSISSYLIYALAYEPTHDILYAGTDHGIWRAPRPNDSVSWSSTGGGLSAFPVKSLAYDPTRDILYAGAGNPVGGAGGVWYCSTPDSTPSWSNTSGDFNGTSVDALAYDSRRDILYAGTSGTGVRRCINPRTAPSWISIADKLIASGGGPNAASSLTYDSAGDALFMGGYMAGGAMAVRNGGVWRCANPDRSDSWTITGMDMRRFDVLSMTYSPAHGVIFAGIGPAPNKEGQGVWRYDLPPLKK